LDNNQQGEICIKNTSEFLGYISEPEKSKEAFDGEWFKTGDIGYFDDDGYIYIIERKKELLKYQGFQVTPTELEGIINEIKGVVSSCVVGVFDAVNSNDIIHAFVIPHESSGLTEEFIHEHVNGKVIDQKRLRGGVHFVKTFPLLLTGKVDRRQMKKKIAEMSTVLPNEKIQNAQLTMKNVSTKIH
jgi:4-coumarate--CoA ligase